MKTYSVTDFRKNMRDVLAPVFFSQKRLILTSQKLECALIPIDDLRKLERLERAEV